MNGDAVVNVLDLGEIQQHLGPVNPADPMSIRADISGDGNVGPEDLTLFLPHQGSFANTTCWD